MSMYFGRHETLVGLSMAVIAWLLLTIVPVGAVEHNDTCDVGGDAWDIDTLSASYDWGADIVTVVMVLCNLVDNKTKYQSLWAYVRT